MMESKSSWECAGCITCPFSCTAESEQAQNYGCLPEPWEIISMRRDFGKTWACHDDTTKPCAGAIQYMAEEGLPYKVIDSNLLTLEDEWHMYVKRNDER